MADDASRALVVRTTTEGKILEVVRDDLGVGLEEGVPVIEFVTDGSVATVLTLLRRAATGEVVLDEHADVTIEGTTETLSFGATPIHGELLMFAIPARERPRPRAQPPAVEEEALDELSRINNLLVDLHRQLARRTSDLEQVNRQKNELLAMAVHDLRNPITTIQGFAETMRVHAGERLRGPERIAVESIERNSQRMARLVDDLLQLSAIEDAAPQLELQDTDLADLTRATVLAHEILAEKKEIALEVDAPDELVLQADGDKLEQVIANLVSNAVKYTPSGGRVQVTLTAAGDHAELTVSDTGVGIPEHEQQHLFEPFTRLSSEPTGGEVSTGLGLAIVHRIVSAHGGAIEVRSRAGEGSTFTVRLPLA
ncbi:MAG: HAMP domain-containing sensor histidine kinase [Nitriliruptorales bacterium]|nr:HAMP domain-containing sensor histidine kinase [Nitriliruptorales bacterium]